jgi:hypothetical protein
MYTVMVQYVLYMHTYKQSRWFMLCNILQCTVQRHKIGGFCKLVYFLIYSSFQITS